GIIVLILYLSRILEVKGSFKKMVQALKNLVPDPRLVLALPPAFIGLLPMLGGALVSAPIVEEGGKQWNLSPAWKTFLNYWFRHIWEYCWPLYVNIILASAILKIPIIKISLVQFPFTILAALLGFILLFKHVTPLEISSPKKASLKDFFELILSIWPILLVIILIFFLKWSMLLSLALVSLLTQFTIPFSLKKRAEIFWQSFSWKTVLLVVSVMVFKGTLEASSSLEFVGEVFKPDGISGYILLFAIPFILAILTGVNHAYVGISFPILVPMIGTGNPDLVLMMFAYVSGFVGILLSPAHLCLVLTLEYFKAQLRDVYRLLIWPSVIIFLTALAALLVFRLL
ncbi:MAG: DUF401 family protein, partial [Acidobacteriota bacterium]